MKLSDDQPMNRRTFLGVSAAALVVMLAASTSIGKTIKTISSIVDQEIYDIAILGGRVVDPYSKTNMISQMFRANYSFNSRYLFTATVRRDGFSGFGTDTKFGTFPSVALAWNISNENFFGKKKCFQ